MSTVFEKILHGELKGEKVFENEHVFAIKDINPIATTHILIITKKVIPSLQDISKEDLYLVSEIVKAAQEIARKLKIENNYRLLTNNGKNSGQSVFHLHFHLISGKISGMPA